MRQQRFFIAAFWLLLPLAASADLFDRGGGLIYDDELDVTWVQVADLAAGSSFDDGGGTFGDPSSDGLLTWDSASAFVDSLDYAGFDDWRLPTMDANNDSVVVDCALVSQTECLDNELGYLYFYGLGGGGNLTGDTPPFTGILFRYWGSDEVAPSSAWTFDFVGGIQGPVPKAGDAFNNPAGAWAVRSGDVDDPPIADPEVLLDELRADVADVGPGRLFARTVRRAQIYNDVPDDQATCAVLRFFDFQVRLFGRLSERVRRDAPWKITMAQMDDLLGQSGAIQLQLECN